MLKRGRNSQDEDASSGPEINEERRESRDSLAPPARTSSWGKNNKSVPSINTALISMGNSVASIATTHARSGSISTTPPVQSPKSPFGVVGSLKVNNTLRRPRSKSDLPKTTVESGSYGNLVNMWKKTGGPPVASHHSALFKIAPEEAVVTGTIAMTAAALDLLKPGATATR